MKYLVLGSSGQIGTALVHYIRQLGEEVIEFDISKYPEHDLRIVNNQALQTCMEACDFVFFLAFDVGGSRYLQNYQHTFNFISNNVRLMQNTFTILQQSQKPFIFASSQMSNMSYSPYGQLKALGELYTKTLNGLTVKFWNVYGVERELEKSHVITDFILKARATQTIDMLTDGSEWRQFLYADDCCECLLKLASEYDSISRDEELHITSFKWHTILDVANIISRMYPGSKISPANNSDNVQKDKRNEPNSFVLKYWQPKTDLLQGIELVNKLMTVQ